MLPKDMADKLRRAVGARDRHQPVAFVGREDELQHLRELVDITASAPVRGAIRIIQGAPGTGKTALCSQFKSRIVAAAAPRSAALLAEAPGDGGPNAPILCADLDRDDLNKSPLDLARAISQGMDDALQSALERGLGGKARLPAQVDSALRTSLGLLTQKLFRGKSWDRIKDETFGLTQRSSLKDCINAYARFAWPAECTIALCLDEAQNCDANNVQARANLQALVAGEHKGRLPLLCFGLPNTSAVLQRMKISCPPDDAVRELGCLRPGEGAQVIERTFDKWGLARRNPAWGEHLQSLGMSAGAWDDWRRRLTGDLAAASGEFPQHIAVGLTSAAGAILNMGEGRRFDEGAISAIRKRHQERMNAYYGRILNDDWLRKHKMALGAICELLDRRARGVRGIAEVDALRLIRVGKDGGGAAKDASAVLQAALDKGVLGMFQPEPVDDPTRGIPISPPVRIRPPSIKSMHTHLRGLMWGGVGAQDAVALSMMEQIDALAPPAPSDEDDGDMRL